MLLFLWSAHHFRLPQCVIVTATIKYEVDGLTFTNSWVTGIDLVLSHKRGERDPLPRNLVIKTESWKKPLSSLSSSELETEEFVVKT